MVKFVVEYGKDTEPAADDGRLDGPSFHRNHDPIWSAIAGFLSTQTGDVLEIGSGTGQHVTEFARRAPHLIWWPSDIYDAHLKSIAAWRAHANLDNLRAPQRIDVSIADWDWRTYEATGRLLAAILCINVLHISPQHVAGNLFSRAGHLLQPGGHLFIYGPFMRDGVHIAPSNAAFDAALRAKNPQWGVRDVRDLRTLADRAGLSLTEISPMPANNLVLIFTRTLRQN